MLDELVELMYAAAEQDLLAHVTINKRAGGNAPLIAERFLARFGSGFLVPIWFSHFPRRTSPVCS
jgi:hypothetical protein